MTTHFSQEPNKIDYGYYNLIYESNVNIKTRTIHMNEDVSDLSLDLILKAFNDFERESTELPINIELSSYGGEIYEMLGIIDRIKSSPCEVNTFGWGKIMSAATFILAAGDNRVAGRNTVFMIHDLSSGANGSFEEIKNEVDHTTKLQKLLYKEYERLSGGKTKASTWAKLCKKDYYINATKAKSLGLIDEVV